jgi:nicotinamidase-related amidase
MRAALIVVDVQNDFKMDAGYYACPMLNEELLSQIESLVSFCRFKKVPIIFTQHSIKTDKSNAEIGEPDEVRACIIGTDGWRVAKEIGPQEDDLYLMKDKYDAF